MSHESLPARRDPAGCAAYVQRVQTAGTDPRNDRGVGPVRPARALDIRFPLHDRHDRAPLAFSLYSRRPFSQIRQITGSPSLSPSLYHTMTHQVFSPFAFQISGASVIVLLSHFLSLYA
jgi:hypothetical protein